MIQYECLHALLFTPCHSIIFNDYFNINTLVLYNRVAASEITINNINQSNHIENCANNLFSDHSVNVLHVILTEKSENCQ